MPNIKIIMKEGRIGRGRKATARTLKIAHRIVCLTQNLVYTAGVKSKKMEKKTYRISTMDQLENIHDKME